MKPKEPWKKRWRKHVAGLALFGTASEVRDPPLTRAAKVLDIPEEVEALLDKMYADLVDDAVVIPPTLPAANGQAKAAAVTGIKK